MSAYIIERRARLHAEKAAKTRKAQFPDFRDHEAVQTFFLQQVSVKFPQGTETNIRVASTKTNH